MDRIDGLGLESDERLLDGDELRVGAVAHIGTAVHLIAHLQPLDAPPDFLDHAGNVPAQDQRQLVVQPILGKPLAYLPIHGVDGRRLDPDQHLATSSLGARHVLVNQDLRPAIGVDAHRFHRHVTSIQQS